MRTENDLREAFDHLAADAPDATEVLARLDRTTPAHRRTGLRIAVTVAATAAAVVAAPLLLDQAPTAPTTNPAAPATQPSGPFPFGFDLPVGWSARGGYLTGDMLTRSVTGPGGISCSVTSYRDGAFEQDRLTGRQQAAPVDGRPAATGELNIGKPGVTPRVLAWEYRAGAWAVAQCNEVVLGKDGVGKERLSLPQQDLRNRQVAESTDFAEQEGLLTPIKLGPLAGGLRVTEVMVDPVDLHGLTITLRGPAVAFSLMVTDVHPGPVKATGEIRTAPVKIRGKQGWLLREGQGLLVRDGEFEYTLDLIRGKPADPEAALIAIAEQVRVADPDRPATWFPLKQK